ncbi:MAG: AI-2E family transporter [Clostridia bacterium]|nr:AI-2E family transporter [Clostridia bacterium]
MDNKKELRKWIILITFFLVGFWVINNTDEVGKILDFLVNISFPFILGLVLAFIINIPMSFFERKLVKQKNVKRQNLIRIISMILAIAVILLIILLVINLIIPRLIEVINLLGENMPYYFQKITELIEEHSEKIPSINSMLNKINEEEIKNQIIGAIPNLLSSSISLVSSLISTIANFFIAIIFAIYILIDKERLKMQAVKILSTYLKEEKANKIINIGRTSKKIFKNFITVQCLEATILGSLCIIGMLILRIPYAMSIGVLIGVTALIPVIGAFIGLIIGAVLIVVVNPIKAVTFVIFVIVLQQIEGNLIYPKVVGNSVGLPGIWVLFAVTIGGSLGGIVGMLVRCTYYDNNLQFAQKESK